MSNRVSASIAIGGEIDAATYAELLDLIAAEHLSVDWDGAPFEPHEHEVDEPLRLCADKVSGGQFEDIEDFCVERGIAFRRWCGAYSGSWDAERVVFTGSGGLQAYGATEDNDVVIGRQTACELGSFEAILDHFATADFQVPPLVILAAPDSALSEAG